MTTTLSPLAHLSDDELLVEVRRLCVGGAGLRRHLMLTRDPANASYRLIAFGDGSIQVFSPRGEQLVRHHTGVRLRTFLPVPQRNGPDLLVTATERGLTAWRPVPAHTAVK